MKKNQNVADWLELYPESVTLDGFDNAIIGIDQDSRIVYSFERLCETLINEGLKEDEVADYIDTNIIRELPRHGDTAPVIMYAMPS